MKRLLLTSVMLLPLAAYAKDPVLHSECTDRMDDEGRTIRECLTPGGKPVVQGHPQRRNTLPPVVQSTPPAQPVAPVPSEDYAQPPAAQLLPPIGLHPFDGQPCPPNSRLMRGSPYGPQCVPYDNVSVPAPVPPPPPVCGMVTYGPPLNMRVAPTSASPAIMWLFPGDQVIIDGSSGRWGHLSGVIRWGFYWPVQGWTFGPYLVPSQC